MLARKHKLFTIYKQKTRGGALMWYARFYNEETGRYQVARSLSILVEGKKERKLEAYEAARAMLAEIDFTPKQKTPDSLVGYLQAFWTEGSKYLKAAALMRGEPLGATYVKLHRDNIRLHVESFEGFEGITMQDLTPALVQDWQLWLADRKVTLPKRKADDKERTVERTLSGARINKIMQTLSVPVNFLLERGELQHDPFKRIKIAKEKRKEKGILTLAERDLITGLTGTDPIGHLAVLLGLLCGMRLGEVRGLQWGDIKDGLIHIRHNWQDHEGSKKPKQGSSRTVLALAVVETAFKQVKAIAMNPASDGLVFESVERPDQPYAKSFFVKHFKRELNLIGIKEAVRKERNITFHGLRHSCITHWQQAGLTLLEAGALAGQKTQAVTSSYTHGVQLLDFVAARQKLEKSSLPKAAGGSV
ncbi:site-specific integrase [Spirochaetia bacterium]|nr:site-specific integrase [Spirochaetia bacterium]